MGGGTGTGGAPIVAECAKESGALVVAVVTKPFLFEGGRKGGQADEGLKRLKEVVDTVITIPNQRLLSVSNRNTSLTDAFKKADEVLYQAVKGISDVITVPGLVNVDFADVKTIMGEMGQAIMGSGMATGENRGMEAARMAVSSPLLEDISISGAKGVLINVTGSSELTLNDMNDASTLVHEEAHPDANIIIGAVIDEMMGDEIRVTVIATGFGKEEKKKTYRTGAMPSVVANDLDIPTVMRREKEGPVEGEVGRGEIKRVGQMGGVHSTDEDIYDTPTFLRKQAD